MATTRPLMDLQLGVSFAATSSDLGYSGVRDVTPPQPYTRPLHTSEHDSYPERTLAGIALALERIYGRSDYAACKARHDQLRTASIFSWRCEEYDTLLIILKFKEIQMETGR